MSEVRTIKEEQLEESIKEAFKIDKEVIKKYGHSNNTYKIDFYSDFPYDIVINPKSTYDSKRDNTEVIEMIELDDLNETTPSKTIKIFKEQFKDKLIYKE
ncbi:hypothetical protein G3567_08455 [Psychroflexus sp. YR1-1]|uniref:Uncharacterized protein n=1 Tax=Psychroflexus aurantiacus TaxID=2709310 RepID=A0A6B3R0P8_9FLAO|nr:hypothetical protein [Psychroflexus aurantiacus]NEV94173.1 hypothetical protein [Psychroflexus aurantiacus]